MLFPRRMVQVSEDGAEKTSQPTDRELIDRARGGAYEAFEKLVLRYRDRIYRLAYGMTKSESEAEEVVQDAFLNVFRSLDRFRGESSPSSWIYRIAANSALMRLRTRRRKPLLSIEDYPRTVAQGASRIWPDGAWTRAPDESVLDQELRGRIEQAVDKLPEKYQLVLLLRDVEGMSNQEAAKALGLTVPTVKTRLHRSRLMVRADLERYFRGK